MLRLIPIAVVIAVVILFLMTGSRRGTFIPLTFNLMATYWAYAAMAAVGVNLTVITLVLGPMLICVGAVYGVHVLARYQIIAADSPDAYTAALRSAEYTRTPILMAGVTTLVGFAVLLYSDIQATNELGIFAMLGIASVTMLSLTGAPAVLALLPLRYPDGTPRYSGRNRFALWVQQKIQGRLGGLAWFETSFSGRILIFWALAAGLGLYLIPKTVIDTDYIRFFLPESRVRQDFAKVNDLLAGAVPVYVTFTSKEEGTFRRPEILRAMHRMQERIEQVHGVETVLSAVDLVQLAHRALEQDNAQPDGIPNTRGGVAEIVFMIPKDMLRKFANSNHSAANLIVRTGELGSLSVRALENRIAGAIDDVGLPDGLEAGITGNAVLLNSSADGIAGNQTTQVTIAALTHPHARLDRVPVDQARAAGHGSEHRPGRAVLRGARRRGGPAVGPDEPDRIRRTGDRGRQHGPLHRGLPFEAREGREPGERGESRDRRGGTAGRAELDHADHRLPGRDRVELRDAARVRLPDGAHHVHLHVDGHGPAAVAAGEVADLGDPGRS